MAQLRPISEYLDPSMDPNQLGQVDPSGLPSQPDVSNTTGRDQANSQAPPPPVGNIDREAFKNDWQSTEGTFDDFMKAHPQYAGQVTPHNGSKDVYDLKGTNETLDLVGDVGGANKHNWTGTGVGQNGVVDQPAGGPGGAPGQAGGLPPAFGSLSSYMGSSGQSSPSTGISGLQEQLSKLISSGGGFNSDAVGRRVSNERDAMNSARQSQLKSNQAALASRGLMGDGPESTAMNSLESRLGANFNSNVNDIYAQESSAADQRLIQALQVAAGMSESDAANAVQWFKAQSDNQLGQGQLALGNKTADQNYGLGLGDLALGNFKANNDYNLGSGNLQLGYDTLNSNNDNTSLDDLIELLKQRTGVTDSANKGYV